MLLATVLVGAACSDDGTSSSSSDGEVSSTTEATSTGTAESGENSDGDGEAVAGEVDVDVASDEEISDADGDADPSVEEEVAAAGEELFPDVVDATATQDNDGTWTVAVTLSSPYDSPERYADAWRVVGPDGTEYGIRELTHDHANEQPFTRSQGGIAIPDDVSVVTIEGRDQVSGWGGETFQLQLSR